MGETNQADDREMLCFRLCQSGQWSRLLDAARARLSELPDDHQAHRYAAQALINLERHREAETHLVKVLARRPGDAFAHRMLSIACFDLKRFREADAAIQKAISLNPGDFRHWYHLAHMCYRQNDRVSGLKWIAKARELAPADPDVLNLYALCSGDPAIHATILREALALDPENALIHNNLGTHYLDQVKDYAEAEACFRRALAINPGLKIARKNLFSAIKHRDRIYRVLRAPIDFLLQIRAAVFGGRRRRNPLVVIVTIAVWLVLARFVIAGVALWFAFVWPMLKIYEFLVLGDLRKKAGEAGARRGGFLRYREWPLHLRLALFGVLLAGFWLGAWFLYSGGTLKGEHGPAIIGTAALAGCILIFVTAGPKALKNHLARYHSWRRKRQLRHLAPPSHARK